MTGSYGIGVWVSTHRLIAVWVILAGLGTLVARAEFCDTTRYACEPVLEPSVEAFTASERMGGRPENPSRSWVVVCPSLAADPFCDYQTLHEAYAALRWNHESAPAAGRGKIRTILVKPGTYKIVSQTGTLWLGSISGRPSGEPGRPLALIAFDREKPPTLTADCLSPGCSTAPDGSTRGIVLGGRFWLLEGFRLIRGERMVFVQGSNNTIRRNDFSDVRSFGILFSWYNLGDTLIEGNTFHDIGHRSGLDHAIYVSNGQDHANPSGCDRTTGAECRKGGIVVRQNVFSDLVGAALQANASDSNVRFRNAGGSFVSSSTPPRYGVHDLVFENNWVIRTRFGINLYRFAFSSRIVNNTFVHFRRDMAQDDRVFIQIRNGAYNVVANNVFFSDVFRQSAIVAYRETPSVDPSSDLNLFGNNVWCLDSGSRFSWNMSGSGAIADRPFSTFAEVTGQGRGDWLGFTDLSSGPCRADPAAFEDFQLPAALRGIVQSLGNPPLDFPASYSGTVSLLPDLDALCPIFDLNNTLRRQGCSAGAVVYPPPPPVAAALRIRDPAIAYRLNVGGAAVALNGRRWEADRYFYSNEMDGQSRILDVHRSTGLPDLRGTQDDQLFLRARQSGSSFQHLGYRIPVDALRSTSEAGLPANTFTVRLHFAETWYGAYHGHGGTPGVPQVGRRVFHVAVEGEPVLLSFDITREGGIWTAVSKTIQDVLVLDEALDIEFLSIEASALVAGIEVLGSAAGGAPSYGLPVQAGWTLLGMPITQADHASTALFQDNLASTALRFNGSGFEPTDFIESFYGYWVQFASDRVHYFEGRPVTEVSLDLSPGWHLVAGPLCTVPVERIDDPDGAIVGVIGFSGGALRPVQAMEPFRAYWIEAGDKGSIRIRCP